VGLVKAAQKDIVGCSKSGNLNANDAKKAKNAKFLRHSLFLRILH
jgi:hypothetical protein